MGDRVTLRSSDNEEFVIEHSVAIQSQTLRAFLSRPSMFVESVTGEISLPIKGIYLKRVVEFLLFRHFTNAKGESEFKIDDSETLELLAIAAYLRI
jgi:hypothetical protein